MNDLPGDSYRAVHLYLSVLLSLETSIRTKKKKAKGGGGVVSCENDIGV